MNGVLYHSKVSASCRVRAAVYLGSRLGAQGAGKNILQAMAECWPGSRFIAAISCALCSFESLWPVWRSQLLWIIRSVDPGIILGFHHAVKVPAINFFYSSFDQGFSTLFVSLGKSYRWLLSYFLIRCLMGVTWLWMACTCSSFAGRFYTQVRPQQ